MIKIKLDWANFKSNVDSRNLEVHYFIKDSRYYIHAFDERKIFHFLTEMDFDSSNASDFTTNYMPSSNVNTIDVIKQAAISDPQGKRARLIGTHFGTASPNTDTSIDWKIPQMQYPAGTNINSIFDGIQYYANNSKIGDTMKFQVVDKDGSGVTAGLYSQATYDTYKDANGEMLVEEFGNSWYVIPNTPDTIKLYRARLYAGLYVRCIYTNTDLSNSVDFVVNLFRHLEP